MTQKIEYSVFVDAARSLVERYGFASIKNMELLNACKVSSRTFYSRVELDTLWMDVAISLADNEMAIKRVYDMNKYCQRPATIRFVKRLADQMRRKGYMDVHKKDQELRATHSKVPL